MRYSATPLPRYRYFPGKSPHPRRDPAGHSYEQPAPAQVAFAPDGWQTSEPYLYGIDLYNHGYFWECHEIFEALWHAFGRETPEGEFFRGLIQIAAANLKRIEGTEGAAQALARRGVAHLDDAPSPCMGIDVGAFITRVRSAFLRQSGSPVPIRLVFPEDEGS